MWHIIWIHQHRIHSTWTFQIRIACFSNIFFLYNSTKYEKLMREDVKKSVALKRLRSHSWLFHDFTQFTYFQSGTTCSYESALFYFLCCRFFRYDPIQLNNSLRIYIMQFLRFKKTDSFPSIFISIFGAISMKFMQFYEICSRDYASSTQNELSPRRYHLFTCLPS